jgi:hypothetical protein
MISSFRSQISSISNAIQGNRKQCYTHSLLVLAFIIGLFIPHNNASAQLAGRHDDKVNLSSFPYHITNYSTQHGLAVNQVEGLAKDPHTGVLVLSTSNGLYQFNGYAFTPYRSHPRYYLSTFSHLFTSSHYEHLLGINMAGDLFHIADEPVLLGKFRAVDIRGDVFLAINDRGDIKYTNSGPLGGASIETGFVQATFIQQLHPDTLLLSNETTTYRYIVSNKTFERWLDEPLVDFHTDTDEGSSYLLTPTRLYSSTGGSLKEIELRTSRTTRFRSLEVVSGTIFIVSNLGLVYYYDGFVTNFTEEDILPTNALTTIYRDVTTGVLVVGTTNKGLMLLNPKRVLTLLPTSRDFITSFGSLVYDQTGVFGVAGRNIVRIVSQDRYEILPSDFDESLSSLALYGDTLYAGSWGNGLFALSKTNGEMYQHESMGRRVVFSTFRDERGMYWVGTDVGLYTGRSISSLKPHLRDSITSEVRSIYQTRSGDVWIGGQTFVYRLDVEGTLINRFGPSEGLDVKDVRAFHEDKKGNIWIGTYGGGLYCYHGGRLESLRAKPNYLIGNDVFTLAEDQNGYMLMSSNNGLHMVHIDALEDFLEGRISYLIPYFIGIQSGMINTEFNGGFQNNHINIGGNVVYFPTIQGVLIYLPRPILPKRSNLVLNEVTADGLPIENPTKLKRTTKAISFSFYVANFTEFDNVHYQYKLEQANVSADWSIPSRSNTVQFDYLPPGDYLFQVRSVDGSNDANPETIMYAFTVLPFFYERASFQVVAVLISLFVVLYISNRRYRQKQLQIQRELETQNKVNELELSTIHAQMNPHLIFNSLNVLVQLIQTKSLSKAENFTVSFAQLLRNILERSGTNFIEVGQEVKLLDNYLQIQKIRFMDAVTYHIECDPALFSYQIPTMLVQPLVENAIVHGLSHTLDGGHVSVRFELDGTTLCIEVADDGIGRVQSATYRAGASHTSMGTTLIHKKIDLIKSKYGIDIELNISDLREGARPGTKATLRIGLVSPDALQ